MARVASVLNPAARAMEKTRVFISGDNIGEVLKRFETAAEALQGGRASFTVVAHDEKTQTYVAASSTDPTIVARVARLLEAAGLRYRAWATLVAPGRFELCVEGARVEHVEASGRVEPVGCPRL